MDTLASRSRIYHLYVSSRIVLLEKTEGRTGTCKVNEQK
jgi:hypothetical protein